MSDQNKALTRDLYENIIAKGQMHRLREVVADDCFDHGAEAMGWNNGSLDHVSWSRKVIHDTVIEVTDMVAEGDRVVAYWTLTGTQEGNLLGVPRTAKKVTMTTISQAALAGRSTGGTQGPAGYFLRLPAIGPHPGPEELRPVAKREGTGFNA